MRFQRTAVLVQKGTVGLTLSSRDVVGKPTNLFGKAKFCVGYFFAWVEKNAGKKICRQRKFPRRRVFFPQRELGRLDAQLPSALGSGRHFLQTGRSLWQDTRRQRLRFQWTDRELRPQQEQRSQRKWCGHRHRRAIIDGSWMDGIANV